MKDRKRCVIPWSNVFLYCFSAGVVLLEKAAFVLCFIQYLWTGQDLLCWLTGALCLPLTAVQLLSLQWYITNEEKPKPSLILLHCLHLGTYHRMWCCIRSGAQSLKFGASLMQQAEVSALGLIETLTVSLPQSLLHTYSLFTLHPGLVSPAALLCQLLWRAGMLGARVATIMFFCSSFHWWTCGVLGFHWLVMTIWHVYQQTDIYGNRGFWHFFNLTLGAVHVFIFLNVKDGPSRYRMTGFYLVGIIFVVLYYRFLHPKSTEILQSLRLEMSMRAVEKADTGCKDAAIESHTHGTFSVTGFPPEKVVQPLEGDRNHHQLIIHLALKTGNPEKINCIYGDRGISVFLDKDKTPDEDFKVNRSYTGSTEGGDPSEKCPVESRERSSSAEVGPRSIEDVVYNTCNTADGSSTVYFSAEAPSFYSATDSVLEREKMPALSPIPKGDAVQLTGKSILNRNLCYTSTPLAELKTGGSTTNPQFGWARRQVHF
ncbi:hypothetical protein DNTS_016690 [Danionella cerebrum]|uniref:XK-related protein n=1 Tax=Danionella cerebrum TaxID=2873325 RepID=A0A553QEF7_9TELE|nr:hypothetical protein DNTS_016690 [Danionella translucida]